MKKQKTYKIKIIIIAVVVVFLLIIGVSYFVYNSASKNTKFALEIADDFYTKLEAKDYLGITSIPKTPGGPSDNETMFLLSTIDAKWGEVKSYELTNTNVWYYRDSTVITLYYNVNRTIYNSNEKLVILKEKGSNEYLIDLYAADSPEFNQAQIFGNRT